MNLTKGVFPVENFLPSENMFFNTTAARLITFIIQISVDGLLLVMGILFLWLLILLSPGALVLDEVKNPYMLRLYISGNCLFACSQLS